MDNRLQQVVAQCSRCSANLTTDNLVSQLGDLESYRCDSCGNEVWFTVSRPLPLERLDSKCMVTVEASGASPTVLELKAMRRLHPKFRDLPVVELKALFRDNNTVEIGVVYEGEALDLLHSAKQLGLTLKITKVGD